MGRRGSSEGSGGGGRGVLGTLLRYELKMLLRDTRMILIAVVAPLVLFPVVILIMRQVDESEERRLTEATYEYAVTGSRQEWTRDLIRAALALEEADTDTTLVPARFKEREPENPDSALAAEELHVVVEGLSPDTLNVPVVRLKYRAGSDFSRRARDRLRSRILEVRQERRDSVFQARGFPVDPEAVAPVEEVNTASAEKETGALLGLALTPFLLFLMLSGGSIAAADAISGEKERGTLETLLTTAASRGEIVRAKQLAIMAVGLAVALVNVLNLLVYLVFGVFELPDDFAVALSGLDVAVLLVLFVPLTALVASALLLLSGYARSYKEYQIYFFPLFLIFLVPSLAGMLPGMDLRSAVAFVPVSGIGVAVREIMVGEYDWLFIGIAFLSTGGAAWWLAGLTERTLSTEKLISSAELDEADLVGGPALFPRHVLRWFLGLWVAFLVVSLWFGDDLGLRGQLVVNLVVIFFGGSLLMVRRYRIPAREAFALRAPHPAAWLAVLVGAPGAFVTGIGIANLVNAYLFPVPDRMIEAFGEFMVGEQLPIWQMILFMAIIPGVFEELAFRGVLLHGLRKKLRPWALCLAVGAIFGLFHVSLFRIVPTGFLGMIMAFVVVLTGSIYPAIAWHALNNALALVPSHLGWVSPDVVLPRSFFALGAAALGVSFYILWRTRTPYPGLKRPPGASFLHGRGGP